MIIQARVIVQVLTALFFLFLIMTGVLSPFKYNLVDASFFLEVLLIFVSVLLMWRVNTQALLFLVPVVAYTSYGVYISISRGTHILDVMQAYKAFAYLVLLTPFIGKKIFDSNFLVRAYWVLIIAFLFKYLYSAFLDLTPRMGTRPGLFVENNFELIFLILYYYVIRYHFLNLKNIAFVVLVAVVFISGSRSAMAAVLLVYLFDYIFKLNYLTLLYLILGVFLFFSGLYLFLDRMSGQTIEDIDRVRFLYVFLNETKDWGVLQYLIGSERLTPLSPESCARLGYYESLFSYSGDGTCYSVILHSYILRVLFDHGIIWLLFLLLFCAYGLRKNNFKYSEIICILGVILGSSLSVSAFNSIFTAIALCIAFSMYDSKASI
jgi:hypothetical protein